MASTKVTVVLILAAIGIVMVGTLAQVYVDIWEVVDGYFRAWVCWVELKILFPPSFFPWAAQTDWDSLRFHTFPFPGGALIGCGLLINLAAAHAVRFRPRARGARLAWGLIVLAAGVATTWLVIQAGHNRFGVQAEPLLAWSTVWLLIRIALTGFWLASVVALGYLLSSRKRKRTFELGMLCACVVGLGLLLTWVFVKGETALLTDSSLRILYQLIQGQIAALVLLAACVILFDDRAGSVLLHGGVGLLMFGEVFVSFFAAEQQMTLAEGQTVSYTRDIRSVELAINTLSRTDYDDVVVVPMDVNGKTTRNAGGGVIELDDRPFDVEVFRYFKNSTLQAAAHNSNLATQGAGLRFVAQEIPPRSGVQGGETDRASAYVRITGKEQGNDLGTYLLSQHFSPQGTGLNTVSVADNSYGLKLRFQRSYKPYQITLLDVRKDDYVGTNMPRNYSSQVKLKDASRNIDFETKIWMNNPLRYAGETFYQSGYNIDRQGKEYSTLQIVKNTGWMIPYVSCMIVATGMLTHFLLVLLRFLNRLPERAEDGELAVSTTSSPKPEPIHRGKTSAVFGVLVPLVLVLLAAAWIAGKAVPPRSSASRMQIEEFGSLPLVYQGRTKPFDTLARNSLRIISNRETFVDAEGDKQPAIRWLLDVISQPKAAERHRVFRIDGLELVEMLGLERRKGFRYAWEEFKPRDSEFRKQITQAQRQDPKQRTFQQRKLLELAERVDHYVLLTRAFHPLPLPAFPTPDDAAADPQKAARTTATIDRLVKAVPNVNKALEASQPPLAVPAGPTQQPWLAYAAAVNNSYVDRHQKRQPAPTTTKLAAIFAAYGRQEAQEFNQAVADYQQLLAEQPPVGLDTQITRFEAYFNHFAPFYHSIPLYFLALVLTAFSWLALAASPRLSKVMTRSAFWLIVMTFAVHTFALGARVVISGRPPVTNLYSSAIFIGWGCVALGLLLEILFRLGVGNFVSAVAGIGTLIIAHVLAGDGDTIRVLQAVLDTQFWLTVHVLTITLGYSAMFMAGLLGLASIGYLLGKTALFWADQLRVLWRGRRLPNNWLSPSYPSQTEQILGSMIYGAICFAAFFSFVGTVLGGLWADDSWGRFWGWDPKENGALIIVLWAVLVLHARWARLAEQRGIAVLAVGGNIVTSWSWFGVNELGVGLHAYGFTEGVARTLLLFWISQLVVVGLSILPALTAWIFRSSQPLEAEPA